jgi:hypothetical protein
LNFPDSWPHCAKKWASLRGFVILNFDAVSGIWAITESGICPFNASNLNSDGGITTGGVEEGVEFPNNFSQLLSPIIPSGVRPFLVCHYF